jgi:hypothetical protein
MQDHLFLSHANPEDNEFARWLALQLAREGYPVWCDLTKLLGGEDFWRDIEKVVRQRTVKFLFVLSKSSNQKIGPLQELQVAINVMRETNVNDYIIPLVIDDMPHQDFNIQLARINAIPFNKSWSAGLKALLHNLEQNGVEKNPNFSPDTVSAWWRNEFSTDEGLSDVPEDYLSNWFPIRELPEAIYFHYLHRSQIGKLEVTDDNELPYPAYQYGPHLVSFADAGSLEGHLGLFMSISETVCVNVDEFLKGNIKSREIFIDRRQAQIVILYILRVAWQKMMTGRGFSSYALSDRTSVYYFKKGFSEADKISFKKEKRRGTYRKMVGHSETKQRFWHFGIRAKPILYPLLAYVVKSHVLFSDDGQIIWEDKNRLHKARRSQCRNWWNSDWRDRLLAAMSWLAGDNGRIEMNLGSDISIHMDTLPTTFTSPVSYIDPQIVSNIVIDEDNEEEDEEESEDEGER